MSATPPTPSQYRRRLFSRATIALASVWLASIAPASASEATFHSFSNSNTVSRINGAGTVNYRLPLPSLGSFTQPTGLAIDLDAEKIYYTRINFIGSVNFDGTGNATVRDLGADNAPTHLELDVDNDHLFFYINNTSGMGRGIYRMNTDGTDLTAIITAAKLAAIEPPIDPLIEEDGEDGLVIDTTGGFLYWSDHRRLFRSTLAGTDPVVMTTFPFNIGDFEIDHDTGKLYYSDSTKIQRSNLDGSSVEIVYNPGFGFPEALELDSTRSRVYFNHDAKLKYTNLDGSLEPVEVIGTGSSGRARDIEIGALPAASKPRITKIETALISNRFRFRITHTSDPGFQYQIESSTDLTEGSWTTVTDPVVGDGEELSAHFPFDAARKFFRVVRLEACEE